MIYESGKKVPYRWIIKWVDKSVTFIFKYHYETKYINTEDIDGVDILYLPWSYLHVDAIPVI